MSTHNIGFMENCLVEAILMSTHNRSWFDFIMVLYSKERLFQYLQVSFVVHIKKSVVLMKPCYNEVIYSAEIGIFWSEDMTVLY